MFRSFLGPEGTALWEAEVAFFLCDDENLWAWGKEG